ncbi:MAG: AI-2E family transporter [Planctomycetota bacterium]
MITRLTSLAIVSLLIVVLGVTFYRVVAPFLLPLFLSVIVAVIVRPLYQWLAAREWATPDRAALVTTAVVLLPVFVPAVLGTYWGAVQLRNLAVATPTRSEWAKTRETIRESELTHRLVRIVGPLLLADGSKPAELITPVASDGAVEAGSGEAGSLFVAAEDPPARATELSDGDESPTDDEVAAARAAEQAEYDRLEAEVFERLRSSLLALGGKTLSALRTVPGLALGTVGDLVALSLALGVFVLGLYYFLKDGPELWKAAEDLIPVDISHQKEVADRFRQAVSAVVLSTLAAATAQGFLTAVGMAAAGFGPFLLLFLLSTVTAMIPIVGTWVVWLPGVVWLVAGGQMTAAVLLTLWGVVVVGTADNLIRAYVLGGAAKLHPLLAFVSILGGLQALGIWGVFIAPVIASCLHALVQVFNSEIREIGEVKPERKAASLKPALTKLGTARQP